MQLAGRDPLLVGDVAPCELRPVGLVQVRDVVGAEQRPLRARLDALHEQVRDPARGVHVVRAPAVVAGVAPQLEELADVVVPDLEVGAARPGALAALVDRDELVVVHLQERDDALGLAVGGLDVRARPAHRRPRPAEPAGPLRAHRVLGDAAPDDRGQRVLDLVDVARRELGVQRAGVEQRRRRGAEAARAVHRVEVERPRVALVLGLGQADAHRHPQPEELRRLDPARRAAPSCRPAGSGRRASAGRGSRSRGRRWDRGRRRAASGRTRAAAGRSGRSSRRGAVPRRTRAGALP